MANCRLELFNTKITPQRNAVIEHIDEYLNTCNKFYDEAEFQYQKIALDIEFKLSLPQDIYQPMNIGNYIRVSQEGKKYYFFVNSYTWTSQNTVALQCSLDTVNTYNDVLYWSDKTNVIREDRDRWEAISSGIVDIPDQKFSFRTKGTFKKTVAFNNSKLIGAVIKSLQYTRTDINGAWTATIDDYNLNGVTGTMSVNMTFEVINAPCSFGLGFHVTYDNVIRKIDKVPEGFTPVLYGEDKGTIYDKDDRDSWYLIYNTEYTEGTPNPDATNGIIKTLLCKDSGFTAKISSSDITSVTLSASQLEQGIYYVVDTLNSDGKFQDVKLFDTNNHQVIATGSHRKEDTTAFFDDAIGFYKEGDLIYIEQLSFNTSYLKNIIEVTPITSMNTIKLNSSTEFKIYKYVGRPVSGLDGKLRERIRLSDTLAISNTTEDVYIGGFDEVDRTQGTLVKIIKLPYCPIEYKVVDGKYEFDALVGKHINEKLKSTFIDIPTNVKFGRKLYNENLNPLLIAEEPIDISPKGNEQRDAKYESKLLHSEFHDDRVVYDSFVKGFDLEKVDTSETKSKNLNIEYKPSRVFNSSFMFTFPEYKTKGYDEENYNNILICNRNNEMPIFSSQYLNYVRNGYNYDVKAKNLALAQSVAGLGIQGALGALGLGSMVGARPMSADFLPIKDYNAATDTLTLGYNHIAAGKEALAKNKYKQKLATASVTAGIGAVAGIANVAIKQIQAEQNLKQKIDNLRATSMSVSNCDDIDLLQEYSGNKAKLMEYKVSEKVRGDLADVFHYTGYKTDNIKVPNFSNRYWFNYVQCEPVFEEDIEVYNDFLNDIKARYAQGVTIYHYHNGWDFEQAYENWETWLVKEN